MIEDALTLRVYGLIELAPNIAHTCTPADRSGKKKRQFKSFMWDADTFEG